MIETIGWTFGGLLVMAAIGVGGHELLRRGTAATDPPVWRSPTFRSDLLYSVIGNAVFAVAFVASLRWTTAGADTLEIVGYGALLLLLHDTYFYWCHRLLHVRLLLDHVHSVHHRSSVPTPLSAMAMHPVEATLEALFVPAAAFALHPPTAAFIAFFAAMIALNTVGHLGLRRIPLLNGRPGPLRYLSQTDNHLQHHLTPDKDFGAYLTCWDRWFGTKS